MPECLKDFFFLLASKCLHSRLPLELEAEHDFFDLHLRCNFQSSCSSSKEVFREGGFIYVDFCCGRTVTRRLPLLPLMFSMKTFSLAEALSSFSTFWYLYFRNIATGAINARVPRVLSFITWMVYSIFTTLCRRSLIRSSRCLLSIDLARALSMFPIIERVSYRA